MTPPLNVQQPTYEDTSEFIFDPNDSQLEDVLPLDNSIQQPEEPTPHVQPQTSGGVSSTLLSDTILEEDS